MVSTPGIDKKQAAGGIALIAALGRWTRTIGKKGGLLWHLPEDLRRFKELTTGHPVIMGRKTWESLPEKVRPLPSRINIVVTRNPAYEAQGASVVDSLEAALAQARAGEGAGEIFVIGGGELYAEALPLANRLYLTLVDDEQEGDVYFPAYAHAFTKMVSDQSRESDGLKYRWVTFERP